MNINDTLNKEPDIAFLLCTFEHDGRWGTIKASKNGDATLGWYDNSEEFYEDTLQSILHNNPFITNIPQSKWWKAQDSNLYNLVTGRKLTIDGYKLEFISPL